MSSSGLIYAVIVGAWAVYLVPMWLRRQDELNERREKERFTTAIRLLGRKPAMERWYAAEVDSAASTGVDVVRGGPEQTRWATRVTGGFGTRRWRHARGQRSVAESAAPTPAAPTPAPQSAPEPPPSRRPASSAHPQTGRDNRKTLLARRRRVVSVLFLLFSVGAITAVVGGLSWAWLPVLPGLLLSLYIAHLRIQERRRYIQRMRRREAVARSATQMETNPKVPETGRADHPAGPNVETAAWRADLAASHRQAVAGGTPRRADPWDPVPVPRPTYADAPVAPRAPVSADPTPATPRPGTPLFDQYEEEELHQRTRAAASSAPEVDDRLYRRAVGE